jgi:hypothetical protein
MGKALGVKAVGKEGSQPHQSQTHNKQGNQYLDQAHPRMALQEYTGCSNFSLVSGHLFCIPYPYSRSESLYTGVDDRGKSIRSLGGRANLSLQYPLTTFI